MDFITDTKIQYNNIIYIYLNVMFKTFVFDYLTYIIIIYTGIGVAVNGRVVVLYIGTE